MSQIHRFGKHILVCQDFLLFLAETTEDMLVHLLKAEKGRMGGEVYDQAIPVAAASIQRKIQGLRVEGCFAPPVSVGKMFSD